MEAERTAMTNRRPAGEWWQRRHLPGRVLALMAIVVASLAAAAPAMADPIGQILVNGSAPNSNGTGLQVSASSASGDLKVTNNSSSYTDIKEIDGVVVPTSQALSKATTASDAYGTSCSISGNSFSCPGLSVAPGASVDILVENGQSYPYNGLSSLNVTFDSIEVNGNAMNSQGKGLQVTAITKKGACPDLGHTTAWCLTVTDLPSSGTPMMVVSASPNSPPADGSATQVADTYSGFGFGWGNGGCGQDLGNGFECSAPFGVSPQEFGVDFANTSFSSGLGDIQVTFESTPCANTATASFDSAIAKAADANCTPPSHTKITVAKINEKKQTAFFKFKAKGTKNFTCELTRNGKRLHYAKCRSPKPYANKLKKGKYVFYVDGTNQGGTDPHPAKKKFTIR